MNRRRLLLSGLSLAAAPGVVDAQTSAAPTDAALRAMLDRFAATPSDDASPEAVSRRRAASSTQLAELRAFDARGLSPDASVLHAGALQGLRTQAALHQL